MVSSWVDFLEHWPDSSLPSGHWLPDVSQGWCLSAESPSVFPPDPASEVTALCPDVLGMALDLVLEV